MQILIELFSNPIALFILIGVISSLFNQKKKDGNQPQRRPVRPPGPVQQPRPAPARRQPAEAKMEPTPPVIVKDHDYNPRSENRRAAETSRNARKQSPADSGLEVLTDIQKKYQERKQQSEGSAEKKQQTGRMSASQTSGRLNQKREQVQSEVVFQPDKDTLVEGLIWAEVLGKPRAKKPYNPARRY